MVFVGQFYEIVDEVIRRLRQFQVFRVFFEVSLIYLSEFLEVLVLVRLDFRDQDFYCFGFVIIGQFLGYYIVLENLLMELKFFFSGF